MNESSERLSTVEVSYNNGKAQVQKFVFPQKMDERTFLREALLSVALTGDTPQDIMTADFSVVDGSVQQLLTVRSECDVTYSATIGYDKEEERVVDSATRASPVSSRSTHEAKYDPKTGKYLYETEKVKVTDWQPYSGEKKIDKEATILLSPAEDLSDPIMAAVQEGRFARFLEGNGKNAYVPEAQAGGTIFAKTPTRKEMDRAVASACKQAEEECEKYLPGDHSKDFRASSIGKVKEAKVYAVPEWVAKVRYQGENYNVRAYKSDNLITSYTLPDNHKELQAAVGDKLKPFTYVSFGLSICVIILAVLICSINPMQQPWMLAILLPLVAATVAMVLMYSKMARKLNLQFVAALSEKRIEDFKQQLAKNHFSQITADEELMFSEFSKDSKAVPNVDEDKKFNKVTAILFFGSLLLAFIAFIMCFA